MKMGDEVNPTNFKIDFVGIGAPKAGTTWLGHMLSQHPQLCMSEPKEVHFFNEKILFGAAFRKPNFHKGLGWYKKYFNHCPEGTLKGEITPRYFNDPLAAERIKEHNPNIKIFVCLRNPVDRIRSQYNFAYHFVGNETRTIEKAIAEEPEYIEMSSYHKNITMYLQHFPIEQFFFIWFEDIQERPEELLREIYSFLNVDPSFKPQRIHEKSNPARKSRFPFLQNMIRIFNYMMVSIGLSGAIKKLKQKGMKDFVSGINYVPVEKTVLSPDLKQYIIHRIKEDVRQLEVLLQKDLSHWLN
jgi:hypothetical protein